MDSEVAEGDWAAFISDLKSEIRPVSSECRDVRPLGRGLVRPVIFNYHRSLYRSY